MALLLHPRTTLRPPLSPLPLPPPPPKSKPLAPASCCKDANLIPLPESRFLILIAPEAVGGGRREEGNGGVAIPPAIPPSSLPHHPLYYSKTLTPFFFDTTIHASTVHQPVTSF